MQRLLPIAIAVTALAILNGTSWMTYQKSSGEVRVNFQRNLVATAELLAHRFQDAFQNELEKRLADFSRESSPRSASEEAGERVNLGLLDSMDDLVPSMSDWLVESGKDLLGEIAPSDWVSGHFQDLYLLDRRGAVIGTLSGDFVPNSGRSPTDETWNIHPLLAKEDAASIERALSSGKATTTEEVLEDGFYYLTAYAPISFDPTPAGLVGIRANLFFGDRLATIRRGMLVAAIAGSLMVLLLTVMFYRAWVGLERAEERFRQQERLAQLGQMVSGVAHEIRNPLGIIEQTADLIRRRYVKEGKDALLDYIPEEVERLNQIVSRFLEFARPAPTGNDLRETEEMPVCDLGEEIRKVHDQLLPRANETGVALDVSIDDRAPEIPLLRQSAARQILLNLVLNALDACSAKGWVRIDLRQQNGGVQLQVADSGSGMTPAQLEKATDPFFTTKEKGSGLGLALVDKLVAESGGDLKIESNPDEGTKVLITFNSIS